MDETDYLPDPTELVCSRCDGDVSQTDVGVSADGESIIANLECMECDMLTTAKWRGGRVTLQNVDRDGSSPDEEKTADEEAEVECDYSPIFMNAFELKKRREVRKNQRRETPNHSVMDL